MRGPPPEQEQPGMEVLPPPPPIPTVTTQPYHYHYPFSPRQAFLHSGLEVAIPEGAPVVVPSVTDDKEVDPRFIVTARERQRVRREQRRRRDLESAGSSSAALTNGGRILHVWRDWKRRKRVWFILGVCMVAVVGVVVGCVLGLKLTRGRSSRSAGEGDGAGSGQSSGGGGGGSGSGNRTAGLPVPTGISACTTQLCTQSLASALTTSGSSSALILHLFARGAADLAIKHSVSSTGGLPPFSDWLTTGSDPIGPSGPGAVVWTPFSTASSELAVFATSASTGDLIYRFVDSATSAPSSINAIAASLSSSLGAAVCVVDLAHDASQQTIDVWILQAKGDDSTTTVLVRKVIDSKTASQTGGWSDDWGGDGPEMLGIDPTSRPGVVCRRQSESYRDVVVFGNETGGGGAWHRQWESDVKQWGAWVSRGGKFHGGTHPVLVETAVERFDFLGLGADFGIYHWSWDGTRGEGSRYSDTTLLGGGGGSLSFRSVPSAAVSGVNNDRMDVVAVGEDGVLRHRVLLMGADGWGADEWQSLGVVSNSAPLLTRVDASTLVLLILAVDGTAWVATVKIDPLVRNWGTLTWSNIAGL